MESAVEHFSNFWRFCSTFEAAHPNFEVSGRQKSRIPPVFCLLSEPRTPILESPVDKNEAFPRFLSTFGTALPNFGVSGRQK